MNFSLNMENNPLNVLYVSFLEFMEVLINFKPYLHKQLLIVGTFSSYVNVYIFFWNMFLTSISKIINSKYLSGVFQLRNGCFRAGPLCLLLCVSLRLAVFAPDVSPASSSLIPNTTSLAVWIAARVNSYRKASGSAIWAYICIFSCLSDSNKVNLSIFLRLLLLTPSNVISLKFNGADVVYALLFIVCILTSAHLVCVRMVSWLCIWSIYTVSILTNLFSFHISSWYSICNPCWYLSSHIG